MNAGLPVLTFPHFSDQPWVSKYLNEAKASIQLIPYMKAARDFIPENMYFSQQMFDAKFFADSIQKLLTI